MAQLPSGKFLSLVPTLHQAAVMIDEPAVESPPLSPEAKPVDAVEKYRRSSSSVSNDSVQGDAVSEVRGQQFLKLGQ